MSNKALLVAQASVSVLAIAAAHNLHFAASLRVPGFDAVAGVAGIASATGPL